LSEANAVRHASAASGARSNLPSSGSADQASPFASILDETSDTSTPPASAWPASPQPQLPSQKLALRPQDGQAAQPSAREPAPPPKQSPSNSPAHASQTGSASSSPSKGPQGSGVVDRALALVALAKKAAKNSTSDANGGAAATDGAPDATGGNNAVDATSTAAAVTDIHGDKPAKSDASTSDVAQAANPAVDPLANQPGSAATQLVAVPVNVPVLPSAPTGTGNGSGSDSGGSGQDAPLAALGDAVKAGALGAKAAGAASATSGGAGSDSVAGAGTKPGTGTADAGGSTPSLTPQAAQKELNSLTGAGQPNAADGTQSRTEAAVAATEAAANHARQQAVDNPPTGAAAGTASNSKIEPNSDPAGPTNVIEDITRQALDTTIRHIEAPGDDTAGSGASGPNSVQAGNAQQSQPPDGSIAPPVLTTAAAPATAPSTIPTPAAIPITGLAVEIASHAQAGNNRFEIRLDPPELGRIDVRLDVDREGKVTSRLVVDRPETLDMLQRDAPQLERSLQQAGLKTADNGLQFSLRDHGGFGSQNPYSNSGSPAAAARVIVPDRELPPVDAAVAGYGRMTGTSTGIDIRV